jgi:hypothetical protein
MDSRFGSADLDLPDTSRRPSTAIPVLLGIAAGSLVILAVAMHFLAALFPDSAQMSFFEDLFDLNVEANVPTWFSSSLWLGAAALAAWLALTARRDNRSWAVVAAIAAYLSLDESATLHERFGESFSLATLSVLPDGVWFFYASTVLMLGFLAVVGLGLLRFVLRLPRHAGLGIIVAGFVFVLGAAGFESLGAAVSNGYFVPSTNGFWLVAIAVEEGLEMLGIILFIHALLWMIEHEASSRRRSYLL